MALPTKSYHRDTGAVRVFIRDGEVPPHAVPGGREANGKPLYIARFVTKEGQLAPGKLLLQYKQAYAGCCGVE